MPLEPPDRDWILRVNSTLQGWHFDGSDVTPNWENLASTIPGWAGSGKLHSFRDLTTSLLELNVKPLPTTTASSIVKNYLRITPIVKLPPTPVWP